MDNTNKQDKPAWRTNPPCQNYKCPFYLGSRNPDPYNNCTYQFLQENCIDYKSEYKL